MRKGLLLGAAILALAGCKESEPTFEVEISGSTTALSAWISASPSQICYERAIRRKEYACVEPSKPFNRVSVLRVEDTVTFRTSMDRDRAETLVMDVVYPESTRPSSSRD